MTGLVSLLLASSLGSAAPRALVGMDWTPAGRGDQTWLAEGQGSGTLVGEFDGLLRPPLTAWGGPAWEHTALLLGLGMARTSTTTWLAEQKSHISLGSLRPSLDARWYLLPREAGSATAWLGLGAHGNIPLVRYQDTSWTAEERAALEETASAARARIGGYGGRVGLGAEVWLTEALALGGRWSGVLHRASANGTDGYTASTWIYAEVALSLALQL